MVGNGHTVGQHAVMRYMDERLKQDMIADNGFQEFKRRTVHRHILPQHGIGSDLHK